MFNKIFFSMFFFENSESFKNSWFVKRDAFERTEFFIQIKTKVKVKKNESENPQKCNFANIF